MFLGFCNKQTQFYKFQINELHFNIMTWIHLQKLKSFMVLYMVSLFFVIMEKLKAVLRAQMELLALSLFNKYINLIYLYIFLYLTQLYLLKYSLSEQFWRYAHITVKEIHILAGTFVKTFFFFLIIAQTFPNKTPDSVNQISEENWKQ